jgi:hypothetical protein
MASTIGKETEQETIYLPGRFDDKKVLTGNKFHIDTHSNRV